MGKLLLISVLLIFQLLVGAVSFSAAALASGGADAANSSFLWLSTGLSLSMSTSYNSTSGLPISPQIMFTVATPTLDEGGLFFPILSSPSFINNTSSSSSSSSSLINTSITSTNLSSFNISRSSNPAIASPFGFSLGFYLLPAQFNSDHPLHPCLNGCNLYMAVCAGSLGNITVDSSQSVNLTGAVTTGLQPFNPYKNLDGFAAPVWVANQEKPIRYADQASLMVVSQSDGRSTALELQLREGEKVVWRVRNGDTMEMQDTGDLLIYNNATNRSHLVWQSSLSDSLVEGQSLTVGRELVSNDSSYLAKMEQGGLVFYMNKPHFNKERQPSPYWLFPVPRSDDSASDLHLADINRMILTAPCSDSPAHAEVLRPDPSGYGIAVYAGSCSSDVPYIVIPEYSATVHDISWIFWRLENDGMLYSYAVSRPQGYAASVTRKQLDTDAYNTDVSSQSHSEAEPDFLKWQECNLPMACGPFGLCTPGAKPFCSCLEPFEAINQTDIFQGCKHRTDLPDCTFGQEHTGSTEFVPFNSTASILLFNGWTFNSTPADVNVCKQSCASDCSCSGFFYQNSTSSCFFITDGITLMNVASFQGADTVSQDFYAVFVTFIKVNSQKLEANSEERGGKISSRTALIAFGTIILFALVCLVLGMARYFFRVRRKKYVHNRMIAREEKELHDILPLLPSRFSYKDLFAATEGFTKILGAGGFGSVYAGVLPDGKKIAVKVLQAVQQGTGHAKQFLAEIATIGRTNHHNIVRLVGFCWEVSQRLLVYEYLERGSLDHWIFVKNSEDPVYDTSAASDAPFLDWKTRYSVALGIARGLNYLHEECERPILHFDIKPQNILLDNDFVAKLADFGMSRLIERDMSAVVTGMRGTPGYIAPEWSSRGMVTKKVDVYSMGMVMLEIVGGRKNLDFSLLNSASSDRAEQDAWHFPSWAARKCEQGLMMDLVDRRLHACGFDAEQALKLIHIAFWCIQEDPAMRPNVPSVVQWLEGSCSVEQPPFSAALRARKNTNNKPVPISFSFQPHEV